MRGSHWKKLLLLLVASALFTITGCTSEESIEGVGLDKKGAQTSAQSSSAYSPKLTENRRVYENDKPGSLVHMYVTVTEDNLTSVPPVTWGDLHKITTKAENVKKVNVIFQEGTEAGPQPGMFGYGEAEPNASLTLRGASSLRSAQKSYKVKIADRAGYWRDQQTINLVKHASDFTRMRNKLAFDYFKEIPNFTSLRTQFVHLHVKDTTGGNAQATFVDYGLYTQIEQPNKTFLRMHGLDPYGHLYKASAFEFFRYPDKLKLADDPAYNQEAFESILEIKGSKDHAKLLQMLDEINDMNQNFDLVFDEHFDRDNYLTWLGLNILMDNVDTNTQNFLLYSPMNSQKWFFLPWDYDGAFGYFEAPHREPGLRAPRERGIQNYWGTVLAKRFFKNPKNVQDLVAKVQELKATVNPENSRKMVKTYKPIVKPFITREPDIAYLPGNLSIYEQELERIINLPIENELKFTESLQKPMPIFLGEVRQEGSRLYFTWDMSYDLQGDELTYHFQLAKEPSFAKPVVERRDMKAMQLALDDIGKGRYFWRVIVRDAKGNSMYAFDDYSDEDDVEYHGVRSFYVK